MIRFTRLKLWVWGVLVILLLYVLGKMITILRCEKTIGRITDVEISYSDEQAKRVQAVYVIIKYEAQGISYQHRELIESPYQLGDSIPMLYLRANPVKAYVNQFWVFWFRPILIIPIIAWSAFAIGIGRNGSYWTLYFSPLRLTRTELQRR